MNVSLSPEPCLLPRFIRDGRESLEKEVKNMSYWKEWQKKVDKLEAEIHSLIQTNGDKQTLEAKVEEYSRLIAESIPY
jgi:hypothetical protein